MAAMLCVVALLWGLVSSSPGHENKGRAPVPMVFFMDLQGHYTFTQGEKLWLQGSPTFVYTEGQNYTTEDGSLRLVQVEYDGGRDKVGEWMTECFLYLAGTTSFQTCAKSWTNPPLPLVVFQQRFINGTQRSSYGKVDDVISGFPSFQVPLNQTDMGYLSYQGDMFGSNFMIGRWDGYHVLLSGGIAGGPLALFDQGGNVIIISPFSGFMSASRSMDEYFRVRWGVMGGVDVVPTGYQYETIVYYGYTGINQVFSEWGSFMQFYYDKESIYRQADLTLNYIGYWTDGGAYYYYATEPNKTYEQTILDIKNYADSVSLPYRYVQYDSWFYPKGPQGGVLTWTPMPDIAPDGFQYIFNKTEWPVAAHNRYWSSKTPYAKQNGGNFNFIVEKEKAIPQDLSFWMYLFEQARTWGLIVYEQDWLNREFAGLNATLTSVDVARTWLMQMGEAARAVDLTIQYCLSYPRHALQTLEIPVVTQARVSGDYRAGSDQWMIGVTSIFAYAMGIAPFKDTFWTAEYQPGNRYNLSEPNGELQAAVATLSTGPVGPSDMIGYTRVDTLLQCCRADGKILQPDKPATAIDKQIWQAAWPGSGPAGQVWTTYSTIGASDTFGIILAAAMEDNFPLSPSDAGFDFFNPGVVMTRKSTPGAPVLSAFSSASPVSISTQCGRQHFCLYYTSPRYSLGGSVEVVIYGEEGKFVPMSRERVLDINVLPDTMELVLEGAVGEVVTFGYFWNNVYCKVVVVIGPDGKAVASLTRDGCAAH
ncbi:uncharacterized protein LOC112559815 isoform X2 [Pomacea canaliculata]|uniref:uncharacterized protein LOC112559815 isoform X2 n=1 Tax=Pomacea canaliculata TaxID=400727 RepID=UPI000D72EF8D|nr:uncharacterized protein LOC112559815 isoform X2 [Pomacea canaliculata]